MFEALQRFDHPEGLRFVPTDVPNELVAEHPLYDIEYRGVFLWFIPIKSYDIYRMRVRVEEAGKTVLLQDERETYLKSWTNFRHEFFKGVYKFAKETDKVWGRRKDGSLGQLYSFTFDVQELKEPVRQLIASAGWTLDEKKFN